MQMKLRLNFNPNYTPCTYMYANLSLNLAGPFSSTFVVVYGGLLYWVGFVSLTVISKDHYTIL